MKKDREEDRLDDAIERVKDVWDKDLDRIGNFRNDKTEKHEFERVRKYLKRLLVEYDRFTELPDCQLDA